jgi:hypothetical protein
MTDNKVIVMVSDLDDAIHGEINVLEGPDQASRFVETLLESGFERERIRVFVGDEMMMEVHHRPVVQLLGNQRTSKEDLPQQQEEEDAHEAPQLEEEEAGAAVTARSRTLKIDEVAAAVAEPFMKNGVRFSTQFRPA